jgi:sulfotransferase family protein
VALIISGHQRSGTTLLRQLCDSHPAMRVTSEVGSFLPRLHRYRWQMRHLLERLGAVRRNSRFSSSHTNLIFVTRYLLAAYKFRRGRIDSGVVEAVLRSMYPRAQIVGDKWPGYMRCLTKLAAVDGLRLVVIYRDCRDVVGSTLKEVRTTWRGRPFVKDMDSAEKIAWRWVWAIESMERHQQRLHVIRYENLVQDPLSELERLGQWLSIDFRLFPFSIIRATSIGSHATTLSGDEVATVMDIASPTMRRLGYD